MWILISQILSLFGYTTGTVLNKTVDVVSGTAKAGPEFIRFLQQHQQQQAVT